MINNNKILTVSYGTFSCTLEGFDDSFGTMKAIAEYFRDLSAGDRYFGAEPVQPDADMLAHIAQQEIARHVEARQENGEIVLRAAETDAPQTLSPAEVAAPVATAASAALASQLPSAPAAEPVEEDVSEAAPETAETYAPSAPADTSFFVPPPPEEDFTPGYVEPRPAVDPASVLPPEDSIASKLQRIRAVVSRGDAPAMSDSFAEDEHSDSFVDDTARDLEAALDADDAFAQTAEEEADTAELDDVHGLLDRLSNENAQTDIQETLDEVEEDIPAVEDAAEETADDIDAPVEETVEETFAVEDTEASDAEEDLDDTASDIEDADLAPAPVGARVVKVRQSELDEALAQGDLEEVYDDDDLEDGPVDLSAFVSADQAEDDSTEDYTPSTLSADEEEALLRELAEVESSLVTDEDDIEDMSASDEDLETMEELENEVQSYTSAADRYTDVDALTEDQGQADIEADVETETAVEAAKDVEAEVEAEVEDIAEDVSFDADDYASDADLDDQAAYEDDTEDNIAASIRANTDGSERIAARLGDSGDEDVSRLMDKAAHEMDEPDNSSRRNAFSHLRAAVAATKADKILGKGADEALEQNEYRKDLEQQDLAGVKPRRPSASTTRTERPNTDRPAPLKLVAEQRVDVETARPSGPVQPRRVAATVADPVAADASSFADYAESMGASKLPELLEAAASYMAYVEGREQFSRPQLMTKVRQVEQDQFSREDGLRSFGQLLRAGKIEKIKGGRFTVSDQIGFKPDEREAG